LLKKEEKEPEEKKALNEFYRSFMKNLIVGFLDLLEQQDYDQPELDKDFLLYSERFMELMTDLQALLPTRRYLNVLMDDLHLIVKCQMSPILEHGDGHLFSQV
jgi:intron-binding protein aquarius